MKAHLYISTDPVQKWPEEIAALCGATVKDPQPVMTLSPDGQLESKSTLFFCQKCGGEFIELAGGELHYVYGIAPAEEALRVNLDLED